MSLEGFSPEALTQVDAKAIETYNEGAPKKFKLHTELGPSPFEGDIESAGIVLLLANPGFDDGSTLDDHTFRREGWPLAGLHPEAPSDLRKWWLMRLKALTQKFGAQHVSRQVAALQLTPWASNKFDDSLRLPSRAGLLALADRVAQRGAVILVMRAERLWEESAAVKQSLNRYRANSWLSSHVSPGNFPAVAWQKVNAVLERAS
jgi:hypothetical protein